uniref:Uncharacterized protein n=1 Tax=Anopheles funestus TaxID=62324 RepID=A0A4Y0BFZ6_ANOFN
MANCIHPNSRAGTNDVNGNGIMQHAQPSAPGREPMSLPEQQNRLTMASTYRGTMVPPNNRFKFMSTTRCEGYVGSRIASRYDEDEEDEDGGVEDVDPDGTIPEEDEDEVEEDVDEQGNNAVEQYRAWHHHHHPPSASQQLQSSREEIRGSVSQTRTRANRYRRAFGGRCLPLYHMDAI